jgi:hypothetical protein
MNAMTENVSSATQPMENAVGAAELETSIAATATLPSEGVNEVTIAAVSDTTNL